MKTNTWIFVCLTSVLLTGIIIRAYQSHQVKGCTYVKNIGGLKGKTYLLISCDRDAALALVEAK